MNFSSGAIAESEGLVELSRDFCKQQMAEKASPPASTNKSAITIGWVPAILFGTVSKVENSGLRFFLSLVCYFVFFLPVMYGFYLFLRAKNRKGKLEKYIEIDVDQ